MQPISKAGHRLLLALWSRVQNGRRYVAQRHWPLSLHLVILVISAALPMAGIFLWAVMCSIDFAPRKVDATIAILAIGGFVCTVFSAALAIILSQEIRHAMDQLGIEADKLAGNGKVTCIQSYVLEVNEISETLDQACRELAERRRIKTLLLWEVDHRVRNTMATILSLARNSCRIGEDCSSAFTRFEGRLIALANVHDVLVNQKWVGAELVPIIQKELMVFTDRAKVVAPALMVPARMALSLSLAFHELTTNAVKYGSLSTPAGSVVVKAFLVDIEQEGSQRELHIIWSERGGPKIEEPTKRGFGSRLIRAAAQNELTGSVSFDYRPTGLQVRIIVPLPDRDPAMERALPWQEALGSAEVLGVPDPQALSSRA